MTTTPEALTPEERALIGSDTSNEDANAVHLARKLLRIHDRQAALLRAWLEWGGREASGFDNEAIELGKRTQRLLGLEEQ